MNIAEGGNEGQETFLKTFLPLFLTSFSGLSTGLGAVVIFLFGSPSPKKLGHLLSFSAGVMLFISFMDLLVSSAEEIGFFTANCAFFSGCLVFLLLVVFIPEPDVTKFIPPKKTKKSSGIKQSSSDQRSLISVGLVTALGISLHNFPEGIAVYLSCLARGPTVGLPLAIAIAAHNIPEGMAVAAPIYSATGSKSQATKYAFLSGLCEPLGAILVALIMGPLMTPYIVQVLLAMVGGIMTIMSVQELLPTTLKYVNPNEAAVSFLTGMFLIFLTVHGLKVTMD